MTEWVTGIDLIREQIRIAAGKHLTYSQEDVHVHGHAIRSEDQCGRYRT